MRATKHSGVDWLGDVPETWGTTPLRTLMKLRTERNTAYQSANYLSLMANIGVIPYAEKGDIGNKAPEDLGKCKIVYEGDFVLNSMNFGIGSFGVSAYNGICSSVYVVMQPRLDKVSPPFLRYIFTMQPFQKHVQSLGNGILEHRAAIGWDELKNIGFPMPPKEEQQAIADFLDRETAQIDTLIAEQETLIRTLEERRGVMIREAVTVGIRGLVKMQDTEIPWVGPVCATWKIAPLKYLATTGAGAGFPIEEQGVLDEPIAFIKVNSLGRSNSEGIIQEFDDTVSIETAARLGAKVYPPETIVLAKIGAALLLGRIRQLAVESCVDNNMMAVTARMGTSARYLFYVLNLIQFERIVNPGAVPSTSESAVKNLKFPFPEFPEQIAIANYLDVETRKLDTIVETTREVVSVLQQRRRSLISAAVTGKIKVAS